MKRYFFFAALFPPMFMNTLLVSARPDDLLHYFIAGYFVAIVPALAAAFVDAILEHKPPVMRAGYCALCALVAAPALFLAFEATAWQATRIAVCAGLAGFICTMAYVRLAAVLPWLQDKPAVAKTALAKTA